MATSQPADPPAAGVIVPGSRREKHLVLWCTLWTALLLFLDQASKLVVERTMEYNESIALIPGCFSLTFVTNKGAAWGMLHGYGWLLLTVGVAVLVAAVFFLRYLTEGYPERYWAIFTIAGGVLGNSIDRMWRGAVVDFFDVYYRSYHWPIFNIADCAICVGVGLFLLSALLRPGRRPHPADDPA